MSEPLLQGKSHDIPKQLIWAAWLKVKSNSGAAGADGVTIEQFEERLRNNLYRLWNRMSSGSYLPGPVRAVEIPKKGGTRVLDIPNVPDGTLTRRTKGTPQGGPISPLIANLFLHYGFDIWLVREFPTVRFERFADDAVVHCVTERQAHQVREAIDRRLGSVGFAVASR